jgi:hypothetical protein
MDINSPRFITAALALLVTSGSWAFDASTQRYAQMLASGGVSSMQRSGEEIFNQGLTDQELLDVAAEALAQNYAKNTGETYVNAMSWLCKALGVSGNGRYRELLTDVSKKAANRKLAKYCDKGADSLPKGVAAYVAGSVDLDRYKEGGAAYGSASAQATPKPAPAAAAAPVGKADFSLVKVGMTMAEAVTLIGEPTNTSSHVTGKAFRPFNFSGKGSVRSYALYKGVGRLVLSNDSAYSTSQRIVEIVPDPTETGFP